MKAKELSLKQKQILKTKDIIYRTAIELFKKNGYDNVKVLDITKAAGISKGSFYLHFSSKAQIIVDQYCQIDEYYLKLEKSQAFLANAPGIERLIYFTAKQAEYIEDELGLELSRILYMAQIDSENVSSSMLQRTRPHIRILEQIIADGQSVGNIRCDKTPVQIVDYLMCIIRGMIYNWILTKGEGGLKEFAEDYYTVVFRSLEVGKDIRIEQV